MKLLRLVVVLVVLAGVGWVGLSVATGGGLPGLDLILGNPASGPLAAAQSAAGSASPDDPDDKGELVLIKNGEVLGTAADVESEGVVETALGEAPQGEIPARPAGSLAEPSSAPQEPSPVVAEPRADDAEWMSVALAAQQAAPVTVVGVLTRIEELGRSTGIACEAIDVPILAGEPYALSGRGDVSALAAFFAALERDPTFAGLSALHVWSEDAVLGFDVEVALAAAEEGAP